jgi:hypothetical protein
VPDPRLPQGEKEIKTDPPQLHPPKSPKWVLAVVAGYILLLIAALAVPWIAMIHNDGTWPVLIIFTIVFLLLLASLMFVPIRIRRQRPLSRRSIWIPLLCTGLLAGLIGYGTILALWELVDSDIYHRSYDPFLLALLPAVGLWALWAGLFYLLTRSRGRTSIALTLHNWLLVGTLLELLIAVPSHLIVRRRGDCCAGVMTGTAICLGVLVAILAFGPAVAILYLKRFRQITPPGRTPGQGFEVQHSEKPGNQNRDSA